MTDSVDSGLATEPGTSQPSLTDTALGSAGGSSSDERASHPREIGHYVVLGELGRGGMGVVYSAYDRKLDRRVALKRIHAQASVEAQARLVREAKAMAKLSHPNVVQIFEIGEHEGTAFLAMEFIEGETLSSWLEHHREAPWSRRLAMLLSAGRGLAAAHEEGLVHRDFKPDNIMIDDSGRVRVMDFGIARGGRSDGEPSAGDDVDSSEPVDGLTRVGAVLGTPAYMAPEQLAGSVADARSDQFGYCVTLWETLYGQRPFTASNIGQLFLSVSESRPVPPRGSSVPSWVRRVIERGLAPSPEHRWPGMAALLDALEADPTKRRRLWLGTAMVAALALGGTALWRSERRAEQRRIVDECRQDAEAILQVWNPSVAAELEQAFLATDFEHAADAWGRTASAFDGFTASWSEARELACTEARLDGTRSADSMNAVRSCLDEAQAALSASVEVLADADSLIVPRGPGLAAVLPRVADCMDEGVLALRIEPPAGVEPRLADLRLRFERARFLGFAGRHEQALGEAEALVDVAVELSWSPFEAEARWLVGHEQNQLGRYEDAIKSQQRAFALAGESGADRVAIGAAIALADNIGFDLVRHQEGMIWGDVAEMFLRRLGLVDDPAEIQLRSVVGGVQRSMGDLDGALASYERALHVAETTIGHEGVITSAVLTDLAVVETRRGDFDRAETHARRALAIAERTLGPSHPDVADALGILGSLLDDLGRYSEAHDALARAREIREVTFGPDHPEVGTMIHNLGVVALHQGRYQDGLDLFHRALEITKAAYGPEHRKVASAVNNIAGVSFSLGDFEEALAGYERALALLSPESRLYAGYLGNHARTLGALGRHDEAEAELEQALVLTREQKGARHRDIGAVLRQLSAIELSLDQPEEALAHAEEALAIFEAAFGSSHGEVSVTLYRVGAAQLELGRVSAAVETLTRGLTVGEEASEPLDHLAETRFLLAKAQWAAGERERARTLAAQAMADHREAGFEERAATIAAWLREHD